MLVGDHGETPDEESSLNPLIITSIAVGAVAIIAGGVLIIRKRG